MKYFTVIAKILTKGYLLTKPTKIKENSKCHVILIKQIVFDIKLYTNLIHLQQI